MARALGLALGLSLVCLTSVASAHRPLELDVNPRVCLAPCTIRITIRIEPHSENRACVLVVDNGIFYRESGWQLEGDQAPPTQPLIWYTLPTGEYTAIVVVLGPSAKVRHRIETTISVNGSDLNAGS